MSGNLFLDWAIIAVSFFNAILLLWLGFTVLLNSDRRSPGLWAAGAGLLLGAAFFISHTAIIGRGVITLELGSTIFWWTIAMVPAIVLPYAWYIITLWYSGFWNDRHSDLRRRQRPLLLLTSAGLALGLLSLAAGMMLLAVPSSSLTNLRLFIRWSVAGIPLLAVGYSIYVVLCIGLSLDALRRPGPPRRVMGDLARRRAHPWMVAASLAMLLVSLLVTSVVLWVVQDARQRTFFDIYLSATRTFAWFDVIIAVLLAFAILMLGQAVVLYEVFTGKTLPRRGLLRHWRSAIILAAGYSLVVGAAFAIQLRYIYILLLTAVLMTLFFALFAWSSYAERERYIAQLRPFITSNRLYDQLLTQATPQDLDLGPPFRTLCADVLDARLAYLAALGPLAPLVGPPLTHPRRENLNLPPLTDLAAGFSSPAALPLPLDPALYQGAVWAVPLWSERGLIGVFLLGEKRSGSLYTQEEIEIARVSGERLIDTQASAEMARRLMLVQRERLAQTQVIDQQTRRVLHDDILPALQTAMIKMSSSQLNGEMQQAVETLTAAHRQISDLLHDMPTITAPEVARLGLLPALQRVVDNEFKASFDAVVWQITPAAQHNSGQIPSLTAEVVFYAAREAVRNAARYGRGEGAQEGEKRPFTLTLTADWQNGLLLTLEDNGVGLEMTGATNKGSGQGLALHSTMMAVVGGTLTIESVRHQHTRVVLTLPLP
ncbi:MAG: hypothetical protein H6659_02345 [Ardenticatenaceae bacterium]|nr:hypothetical protein [Ardenticatenaceae bacterium]